MHSWRLTEDQAGPIHHDDGEINRSLPGDGLPQFVLIDAAGEIVYAKSGFDEHELRAAIGRLGPGYVSLDNKIVGQVT